MSKHRKTVKQHTKKTPFNWLDGYLTGWKNFFIATSIVTLFYFFGLSNRSDLFLSIYFALFTVWGYISCRKYGFLDTVIFLVVLPFMLMSALITLINARQKEKRELTPLDYYNFIHASTEWVNTAMNETYAGKVLDARATDGRVYVKVETPFGIEVPKDEVIAGIAKGLHVSPSQIVYDIISETRGYYVFDSEAVWEFTKEKYHLSPIMTFSGIKERLLCTSSLQISQQVPQGSSLS